MQSVTSTVDVPYWEQNKPWLSPVYSSYFPTLHTTDNSSWAVLTYLPAPKKKSSLLLPNQSVNKTRLWGLSWASFDQVMKIDKRISSVPDPSLRVGEFQFLNWGRGGVWLVPRTVAIESRFPRREADSRLIGFAWHYLTEFWWRNSLTRAKYYSLAKEQDDTVPLSFLNLASIKLEPLGLITLCDIRSNFMYFQYIQLTERGMP